jgi:hypothetical protein
MGVALEAFGLLYTCLVLLGLSTSPLPTLEHDGHDRALRSVGATRLTSLFLRLRSRYPLSFVLFFCCFALFGFVMRDEVWIGYWCIRDKNLNVILVQLIFLTLLVWTFELMIPSVL